MTAYASAADLIVQYDVRIIGDLINDDGTRATSGEVSSSPIVDSALAKASGEVDAACLRGNRYTTTQLAALTGNSAAYLKSIVCKIAFWILWERRPAFDLDQYEQAKNSARGALDQLKRGEIVFDVAVAEDAGNPRVSAPTRLQLEQQNLPIERYSKFYPARQLPSRMG